MSSTSDEVGHTAFDLETIGYYVGNPSAWEEGFDQRISDQIGKAVEEIQRLRNSHDSLVKALETAKSFLNDQLLWNAIIDIDNQEETLGDVIAAAISQAKGGK